MNTDTIDFPTIDAPPAPATPPSQRGAGTIAVAPPKVPAVPSIKETVLAQFAEAEAAVTVLVEKYRNVAYDVTTTKGMNDAKAARLELREKGRFAVQRAERSVKADVNDLKRVMADEVERIVAIVQPVEDAIDAQIKAREKQLADEKAERDRIEAERVAAHQAGIAKIRAYLTRCQEPGMTAARIAVGVSMLEKVTFGPEWQEFAVPAANAQRETLEAMRALGSAAAEREAEAARLEAQRIEQERVAAEQAEKQRVLAEMMAAVAKRDEEQRAEQARLQRETAEQQQHMRNCEARIAEIHAAATGHENASWDALVWAVADVEKLDVSEATYKQYAALAAAAKESTLAALRALRDAAGKREAEEAPKNTQPVASPAPVAQDGVVENPVQSQPDSYDGSSSSGDATAVFAAVDEAVAAADDSTAPGVTADPAMTLGAINERIAPLSISGAGLALLGFEPAAYRKFAGLFHESDWPAMRAAMVKHLQAL